MRDHLRDVDNLDFRPLPYSSFIDAGVEVPPLTDGEWAGDAQPEEHCRPRASAIVAPDDPRVQGSPPEEICVGAENKAVFYWLRLVAKTAIH